MFKFILKNRNIRFGFHPCDLLNNNIQHPKTLYVDIGPWVTHKVCNVTPVKIGFGSGPQVISLLYHPATWLLSAVNHLQKLISSCHQLLNQSSKKQKLRLMCCSCIINRHFCIIKEFILLGMRICFQIINKVHTMI